MLGIITIVAAWSTSAQFYWVRVLFALFFSMLIDSRFLWTQLIHLAMMFWFCGEGKGVYVFTFLKICHYLASGGAFQGRLTVIKQRYPTQLWKTLKACSIVIICIHSTIKLPGIKSQNCHILAMWPRRSDFTTLYTSIILVPQGWWWCQYLLAKFVVRINSCNSVK